MTTANDLNAATTIEFIKLHATQLKADSDAGQREARQVIEVYGMYYRHADHCTLGILMGAVDSWVRRTQEGRNA